MNSAHWDSLAQNFNAEVLQIVDRDLSGVFFEELDQVANGRGTAADLGCGAGSLLPHLGERFEHVYAVDFAPRLLELAERNVEYDNVEYVRCNLASSREMPFEADVTFCVNALIHPRHFIRQKILNSVFRATAPGGSAMVVTPSLESVYNTYQALIRCAERQEESRHQTVRQLNRSFSREVLSPVEGIVDIGGAQTKCFMLEELLLFMEEAGFELERARRVRFPWSEEIADAPRWLRDPYPWDWLIVARRAGAEN